MSIFIGILEQGLIYAIVALGVYISFKILDFPDMGIESTFTLGGAVTAILILNGVNPILCLLISFAIGGLAGALTGIIHIKLKVRDLLAGIIVMMMLYSVNLRIVGKSNVSIFNTKTIFNNQLVNNIFNNSTISLKYVLIVLVIIIICKILLDLYLKTKSGYLLKAVGENDKLVTGLGINSGNIKILGLIISNALGALAGSVLCQQQQFYDINMGSGIILIAITSVVIGINLFGDIKLIDVTLAVIIGSILYKVCVSLALSIGFEASDIKLITSILFLIVLILKEINYKGVMHNDRIKKYN